MKPVYTFQFENYLFETYNSLPKGLELAKLNQVHSSEIVNIKCINSPADGFSFKKDDLKEKTPAVVTADCLPIWIMTNNQQHYLLHAGWRGLSHGIIQKIKDDIYFALIGPSIQARHYEVQESFKENFPNSDFFQKIDHKLTFNLQQCAKKIILDISPDAKIEISSLCTYEKDDLHSYRQNKTQLRNWSIVRSLAKIS